MQELPKDVARNWRASPGLGSEGRLLQKWKIKAAAIAVSGPLVHSFVVRGEPAL